MPEPTASWLTLTVAGPIVPELGRMVAVAHTGWRRMPITQLKPGPEQPYPNVYFIAATFEVGWGDPDPVAMPPPYRVTPTVQLVPICIHPRKARSSHENPESILRASKFNM